MANDRTVSHYNIIHDIRTTPSSYVVVTPHTVQRTRYYYCGLLLHLFPVDFRVAFQRWKPIERIRFYRARRRRTATTGGGPCARPPLHRYDGVQQCTGIYRARGIPRRIEPPNPGHLLVLILSSLKCSVFFNDFYISQILLSWRRRRRQ